MLNPGAAGVEEIAVVERLSGDAGGRLEMLDLQIALLPRFSDDLASPRYSMTDRFPEMQDPTRPARDWTGVPSVCGRKKQCE
jgi:hypothetical protein